MAVGDNAGVLRVIYLDGREPRLLPGFSSQPTDIEFSPSGRTMAVSGGLSKPEDAVVRVWDLETGDVQVLDAGDGVPVNEVAFLTESQLVSGGRAGLLSWDLKTGMSSVLSEWPI